MTAIKLLKNLSGDPKENGHRIQTIDGKKVVVLTAEHGTDITQPGIARLTKKTTTGIRNIGELANTEKGQDAADCAASFKAAGAAMHLRYCLGFINVMFMLCL